MSIEAGIALGFLALFSIPFAIQAYDSVMGTQFNCHNIFRWHNGKGDSKSFDGCSVHSTCSKCGTEVMQDSQGNWF